MGPSLSARGNQVALGILSQQVYASCLFTCNTIFCKFTNKSLLGFLLGFPLVGNNSSFAISYKIIAINFNYTFRKLRPIYRGENRKYNAYAAKMGLFSLDEGRGEIVDLSLFFNWLSV